MKATDRIILLALLGVGLVAAFWFLILAPKRERADELEREIAAKQAQVAEQEQLAAMAGEAKEKYAEDYQELVVLGKAVPADADQASLVEQLNTLARKARIDFQGVMLSGEGSGEAPAQTPPPTEGNTGADGTSTDEGGSTEEGRSTEEGGSSTESGASATTMAAPAPAPATEAAAATLPIGATVGSAGLPVMPYDLKFTGDFFQMADFFAGIDGLVRSKRNGKKLGVSGRLLTIDGFSFGPSENARFPVLDANLHVTSYVAPADQGLTGGATPTEPAPSTSVTSTASATPPVAATTP